MNDNFFGGRKMPLRCINFHQLETPETELSKRPKKSTIILLSYKVGPYYTYKWIELYPTPSCNYLVTGIPGPPCRDFKHVKNIQTSYTNLPANWKGPPWSGWPLQLRCPKSIWWKLGSHKWLTHLTFQPNNFFALLEPTRKLSGQSLRVNLVLTSSKLVGVDVTFFHVGHMWQFDGSIIGFLPQLARVFCKFWGAGFDKTSDLLTPQFSDNEQIHKKGNCGYFEIQWWESIEIKQFHFRC